MRKIIKSSAVLFAATIVSVFIASCKKEMFDGDPEHMPIEGVEKLVEFMKEFEKNNA